MIKGLFLMEIACLISEAEASKLKSKNVQYLKSKLKSKLKGK
jgi:hypothetical protein